MLMFTDAGVDNYYLIWLGHGMLIPLHYALAVLLLRSDSFVGSFLAVPLLIALSVQASGPAFLLAAASVVIYWAFMQWAGGVNFEFARLVPNAGAMASSFMRRAHVEVTSRTGMMLHALLYWATFGVFFLVYYNEFFELNAPDDYIHLSDSQANIALGLIVFLMLITTFNSIANIFAFITYPISFLPFMPREDSGKMKRIHGGKKDAKKPRMFFRYVTRGTNPSLMKENLVYAHGVLQDYSEHDSNSVEWQLEVVTDNKLDEAWHDVPTAVLESIVEILVPKSFKCPNGGKFKARAMHYAVKDAGPQLRGVGRVKKVPALVARKHDWIIHLDEETLFNAHTITECFRFCQEENQRVEAERLQGREEAMPAVGQGVILYNCHAHHKPDHALTVNADLGRVGDDFGKFHAQYHFVQRPIIGMHGSFVACCQEVEEVIGYDF